MGVCQVLAYVSQYITDLARTNWFPSYVPPRSVVSCLLRYCLMELGGQCLGNLLGIVSRA